MASGPHTFVTVGLPRLVSFSKQHHTDTSCTIVGGKSVHTLLPRTSVKREDIG